MRTSSITRERRDFHLGWRDCRDRPLVRRRYIYEVTRFGKHGEEHYRPSWDVRISMRVTAAWLALDPELRDLIITILVIFAIFLFGVVVASILHGWSTP